MYQVPLSTRTENRFRPHDRMNRDSLVLERCQRHSHAEQVQALWVRDACPDGGGGGVALETPEPQVAAQI